MICATKCLTHQLAPLFSTSPMMKLTKQITSLYTFRTGKLVKSASFITRTTYSHSTLPKLTLTSFKDWSTRVMWTNQLRKKPQWSASTDCGKCIPLRNGRENCWYVKMYHHWLDRHSPRHSGECCRGNRTSITGRYAWGETAKNWGFAAQEWKWWWGKWSISFLFLPKDSREGSRRT